MTLHHQIIVDPARLQTLERTHLLDTPPEDAFDRLTTLATQLLDAPIALVSLVDKDRQFFKSGVGLDEPTASARQTPLSHSFCQYVVSSRQPLIVPDARGHELLADNPAIPEMGVIAYAGIPLLMSDGQVLGSFCAIDTQPHGWSPMHIKVLETLAQAVIAEIELRLVAQSLMEQNARLQVSEERFRALVQNSTDVVTLVDEQGIIQYESPSTEQILGYTSEALVGESIWGLIYEDDLLAVRRAFERVLRGTQRCVVLEYRLRHKDGSWRWIESRASNHLTHTAIGGIIFNSRDITERKELEAKLHHRAYHDPLTGLPNRALFQQQLEQALSAAQLQGASVAVCFLDLDGFKVINDTLGHAAGDQVLEEVGKRLREQVRPGDTVARFAGDEFTILLRDMSTPSHAFAVAHRIIAALGIPLQIEGQDVSITISIGIAVSSPEKKSAGKLMEAADIALYRAKHEGKARCVLFDPTMYMAFDDGALCDSVALAR